MQHEQSKHAETNKGPSVRDHLPMQEDPPEPNLHAIDGAGGFKNIDPDAPIIEDVERIFDDDIEDSSDQMELENQGQASE
ncbi:nucleoside transporter 1 [Sesbania bispinosa]|nr:nucleoside transporter 1 [Sesbania bispinosa]